MKQAFLSLFKARGQTMDENLAICVGACGINRRMEALHDY